MGVIIKTQALLSPAGARVVMWKQPKYMKKTSHVAVPRRGASCYYNNMQVRQLFWLLSPAGARVVTNYVYFRRSHFRVAVPRRGASCYQGSKLWACHYMVAVPRRGASCYVINNPIYADTLGCCPPQGRELLQQKCEKYNADFRHSYNLFVLSSVFLRIHS